MPRNITVTFDDGSTHVYQNAPDEITPEQVMQRASSDFGRSIVSLDGGRKSSDQPATRQEDYTDMAVRMAARGITGLGELAIDMPLSAGQWVGNKINDAIGQPHANFNTHPVRSMTDAGLNAVGVNPQSSGAVENIAQAGISALTGAGEAKILGDAVMSAMPIRQTVGALTGSATNEAMKEADAPEWAQMIAPVLAGMAGSNIAGAVGGIGKGVADAGKLAFSEEARREAAARAFYRQTTNPDLAIERLKNPALRQQFVPNSSPITAEVAQDAGLAMLNKSVSGNPFAISQGVDQIGNQRISDLSHAVDSYLNRVNRVRESGDDALTVLDKLKADKLSPFLASNDIRSIPVDGSGVIPTLEEQFANFSGNAKVEKFVEKTTKNLYPNAKIERVNGELKILEAGDNPSFNQAWNARKGIDDLLYDKKIKFNSSPEIRNAANVAGGAIRASINDALKQAVPDFEDVLGTLAKANKMQTALETGRGLQDKLKNSAITSVQNANDLTGVNKISAFQAMKIGKDLTNSRGQPSDLARNLTKSQREAFANVAQEMERSKALESLGSAVGSPTASYIGRNGLLKNDILDSILGAQTGEKAGLLRMAGQSLGTPIEKMGLLNPLEESVMREIGKGMINPDHALGLLELGKLKQRGALDITGGLKNSSKAGLTGLLYNQLNQ